MAGDSTKLEVRTTADGRQLPLGPVESARTHKAWRGGKASHPPKRFTSGKQVDPAERAGIGWSVYDHTSRRAYGREDATLDLLKAVRDLDPVVSQAVWNYLRQLNPGHRLVAVVDGPEGEVEEEGPAQAFLDELAARVGAEYGGGLDQLHNVLALSLMTAGAVAAEVAPTAGLNDVEDWYPIDPAMLSFRRDADGTLALGQLHADGVFRPLPPDQVFYQPLDPDVNDPYGRPPFLAAVQAVLAQVQILTDIRAVAHQAGYPRIDVEIVWDVIQRSAPPSLREPGQEAELITWAEKQLTTIVGDYESLQVDDTFVHYDWVKPSLMASSGLSFDFPALDGVLQRRVNSGLKSLPILLGINEGVSETHGSVQWQIQIAGVNALQRVLKRTIEKLGNASLQLAGFAATAKMRYDDTRTVDRLYAAQAELFEAQSLKVDVEMGWRDNNEAAMLRTGGEHGAVADPGEQVALSPAPSTPTTTGQQGGQNPSAQEKQQAPGWQLLWHTLRDAARAYASRQTIPIGEGLDGEMLDELSQQYAEEARRLFQQMFQTLVATMLGEGFDLRAARATPREIADDAFGLAYRREMKKLLRQSIADGYALAGVTDATVPEKLVRRIWQQNEPFLRRIRDDMAAQVRGWSDTIRSGGSVTMEDVAEWFSANEYREAMMGQFLTKQGLATGYTQAQTDLNPRAVFRWTLGPVKTEHCEDCLARADKVFTEQELRLAGMPGSINLRCVSNCKCSLVIVSCSSKQMAGRTRPSSRAKGTGNAFEIQMMKLWKENGLLEEQGYTEADYLKIVGTEDGACQTSGRQKDTQPRRVGDGYDKFWGSFDTSSLTDDEDSAVFGYLLDPGMNERLRAGESPAGVRLLDSAIGKGSLNHDVTLYRGTTNAAFAGMPADPRQWVGSVVWDDGFMSTSSIRSVAEGFGDVTIEIRAPKGTNALPVDRAIKSRPEFTSEGEVLLGRGTGLRIDAVQYDDVGRLRTVQATVEGWAE